MDGDAELVARVRRGDRDSFDELYDRYADDVFSTCLVILGDPAVARAAAGTAFALVARTRLDPLSDPERLRPWLLELARGSALAWSGSPQARSVPIPHGVSAEDMIDGAVVPAPASLRAGLVRTFDRAAMAAAEEMAAKGVRPHQPAPTPANTDIHDAPTEVKITSPVPVVEPAPITQPQHLSLVKVVGPAADDEADEAESTQRRAGVFPLPRDAAAQASSGAHEWRTKPALTIAAALVVAVAGVTAAINWPSPDPSISADGFPEIAVVTPTASTETAPPKVNPAEPAPSPTIVPTVAGAFTSMPADDTGPGEAEITRPRSTSPRAAAAPPPAPPAPPPAPAPPPTVPETTPAPTTTTRPPTKPTKPPETKPTKPTETTTPPTDAPAPTGTATVSPVSPTVTVPTDPIVPPIEMPTVTSLV